MHFQTFIPWIIGAAVIVAVFAVNWMLGKKHASAN